MISVYHKGRLVLSHPFTSPITEAMGGLLHDMYNKARAGEGEDYLIVLPGGFAVYASDLGKYNPETREMYEEEFAQYERDHPHDYGKE